MTKPRGIQWLETQTAQTLDPEPPKTDDTRHLSLRLPTTLHIRLEQLARERDITVSQLARELLADGLTRRDQPSRAALDAAIALLDDLRRKLPNSAA